MTATALVKAFLSCGHGLQNASSQVETRGSNSGFFELSIRHTKVEILRLKSCFLRDQERLVLKFPNVGATTHNKTDPRTPNIVGLIILAQQLSTTNGPKNSQHCWLNNVGATTINNTQQTDATCNIEQCWELFANDVASV